MEAPTVAALPSTETPSIQELAKQTFLRPMQVQQVQQSVEHGEEILSKHEMLRNVFGADINVEEVQRVLELDKRTLEMGRPPEYAGNIKNRLNKARHMLEQSIVYDMPTTDDMWNPTAANVDKHMAWESVHKDEILAWKSICRILDPVNPNPNFTNVERLRSNTPPKGDPRKYWKAFDNIQWEEDIDEELVGAIDDHEYLGFLELRALGWAKANICRRLMWSKEQYAAAAERFRRSQYVTDADASQLLEDTGESLDDLDGIQEEYKTPPKKTVRPKKEVKVPVMQSEKWPIPELRKRDMTLAEFGKLSSIHHIRISRICSPMRHGGDWREEEREQIQAALDTYDKAHAFVAHTGEES